MISKGLERSVASSPFQRMEENVVRGVRNVATVVGRISAALSPFNFNRKG